MPDVLQRARHLLSRGRHNQSGPAGVPYPTLPGSEDPEPLPETGSLDCPGQERVPGQAEDIPSG